MVTAVTSFGRNGMADWLVQRVSAVILAAYTFYMAYVAIFSGELTYAYWADLFSQSCVRYFTLAALLSAVAHAWIGLWSVTTDYLTTRLLGSKGTVLRILAQMVIIAVSAVFVVWGIEIIWSVN